MKDMLKRILKVLALFSVSALCFCYACSCGKTDEGLKNFNLSAGSATIIEGEKFVITTDLSEDVAIIWESDDEAVATVENGTVSGVATGEATITATAGNTVKKCYVTVIKETRRAVLTIANAEDGGILKLGVNYKYTLNPKVYFDGKDVTEESTFEYRAENDALLSVDGNGEITTKEIGGETTITVIAKYREKTYETLCVELKCIVVADEWNVFTDTDEPLYALAEYDGVTYKNTAAYSAELILSGKSADASLIRCKAIDENGNASPVITADNGIITAKRAGKAFLEFSYEDGARLFIKRVEITVLRVGCDLSSRGAMIFERRKNPDMSSFAALIDEDYAESVTDVFGNKKITVSDSGNGREYLNLSVGDGEYVIDTDKLSVRIKLHVIDYLITTAEQFRTILPRATDDYIEIGNDIDGVGEYIPAYKRFTGVVDGLGHTVSDLIIKNRAIFSDGGGILRNLCLDNVTLGGEGPAATVCTQTTGDGMTVDNVMITVNSVKTSESHPVGGVYVQVGGSGVPRISNSIVVMNGINSLNAGAFAGAWWGGEPSIVNSYFITDGNPYGNKLFSGSNDLGNKENEKGSWAYIFKDKDAFVAEMNREDSSIVLTDFDTAVWKFSQNDIPVFRSAKTKTEIVGALRNGELYYFDKSVSADYIMPLPAYVSGVSGVNVNGKTLNGIRFEKSNLIIPAAELKDVGSGKTTMNISAKSGYYYARVTIADRVIKSAEEYALAIEEGYSDIKNDKYFIMANNVDFNGNAFCSKNQKFFFATFDGNGYAVQNMKITGYGAFGGYLRGTVKNLALVNARVVNEAANAVIANEIFQARIENVFISARGGKKFFGNNGQSELLNVIYDYDKELTAGNDVGVYKAGELTDLPDGYSSEWEFSAETKTLRFNGLIVYCGKPQSEPWGEDIY